ncbi:MAG: MBL fold metallo-hydrolase [Candidatus Borkfalkiaceae bacterium]|nr:MBL fold metallo-hydrolase [Christensenellaceae bacterium]
MTDTANAIARVAVPQGKVACFWLGQAGFVFKTSGGVLIAVDPYFSDCCNRYFGFRRITPAVMRATDVEFDYLFASHAHFDHFDPDSVPLMMQNGRTKLICASDCATECGRLGIDGKNVVFLKEGEVFCEGEISAEAVSCDHGSLAPLAVGFLFGIAGKKIYFTGDTSFREDYFTDPRRSRADLLILPINGAFGNLNEEEAVRAACLLRPKAVIPCHFWNFKEHGGDPQKFYVRAQEEKLNAPLIPMGEYLLF